MRIANNIAALKAFNILSSNNSALQKTMRTLSSGLRINSAADDASGLAISEKMRSQIGGLDRALHNTQDGISLLQTAEGALNEITSMLQRMRELSVQAANGTLTQQDRSYIQDEIDQLKDEINRTSRTTQFNKKKILNGDVGMLWSSNKNSLSAVLSGSVNDPEADNFEGNYDLTVRVDDVGKNQVQKTSIFMAHNTKTRYTEDLDETVTEIIRTPYYEEVTTVVKELVEGEPIDEPAPYTIYINGLTSGGTPQDNVARAANEEQVEAQSVADAAQVVLDRKTGEREVADQEYADALLDLADAMINRNKEVNDYGEKEEKADQSGKAGSPLTESQTMGADLRRKTYCPRLPQTVQSRSHLCHE